MKTSALLNLLASPTTHRPLIEFHGSLVSGEETYQIVDGIPILLAPNHLRYAFEDCDELHHAKKVWDSKPILRKVYQSWYGKIVEFIAEGDIGVEVSGGSGNFKEYFPAVYNSDIRITPHIDFVTSATSLALQDSCLDYIVVIDGIHHYPEVFSFFSEALRVLKPGGRLIFCEPYLSVVANMVRSMGHHEDIDWNSYIVKEKALEANLAIPTKLFFTDRLEMQKRFPAFCLKHLERLEPLLYPLTGGFNHRSLIPISFYRVIRTLEKALPPGLFAFKMFGVLEKSKRI